MSHAHAAAPVGGTIWTRPFKVLFALFVLGMALFLIPENAISLVVFAVDSKAPVLSGQEEALFDWAGEETPSDAVFIDSADRVEMLVRGPRRQYWGNSGYAYQWGYPAEAMERRRALRDAVYEGTLTAEQLDDLRALGAPVFVIGRESDHPGIGARLLARPDRFRAVFSEGDLWVFEVRIPEGPRS